MSRRNRGNSRNIKTNTFASQGHGDSLSSGFFWGGCIGGIIGAICGLSLNFKPQRQFQDIIDQIEDLTAEQ